MIKQIPDRNKMEALRKELGFDDRGIFEKTIYAFNLLSELLEIYPNLIFKGGTSILLHIFPPARLSIDIDILLPVKERADLKDTLIKKVSTSKWFDTVEENVRGGKIPKAHYKFYYTSQFSRVPQYILLDVVFTEHSYKNLVKRDISKLPLVFFDSSVVVLIPTPEGLLGDKMTAVSPNTMGIPLNEKRSMEVLKQIIDLGELFNVANDMDDFKQSFISTAQQENGFRGTSYSINEVVDDIMGIAFKYSQYLLKSSDNSFPEIALINDGLGKVSNHLRKKVGQQDVKVAIAKIVYMTAMLKSDRPTKIVKKVDLSLIEGRQLPEEYKILERLKVVNPEAYFYWVLGSKDRRLEKFIKSRANR